MKNVYVISTISRNEKQNITEFSISQEAYSSLEKAQKFCESRQDAYQIDDFNYEQFEEDDFGWTRSYTIFVLEVKI